jgi:hypothetical protein
MDEIKRYTTKYCIIDRMDRRFYPGDVEEISHILSFDLAENRMPTMEYLRMNQIVPSTLLMYPRFSPRILGPAMTWAAGMLLKYKADYFITSDVNIRGYGYIRVPDIKAHMQKIIRINKLPADSMCNFCTVEVYRELRDAGVIY